LGLEKADAQTADNQALGWQPKSSRCGVEGAQGKLGLGQSKAVKTKHNTTTSCAWQLQITTLPR